MSNSSARKPLEDLLGGEITGCACGKVHRIPTREAHLRPGCFEGLPQLVERYFAQGPVLVVVDANTWSVAGERAAEMLRKRGRSVAVHAVDEHSQPAHADEQAVEALMAAARRSAPAGMLAVGSGTINDIGKSAATATGCPLITVATAASMNGYPSSISALTVQGVKVTEPCDPPVAIIADPEILATAPAAMGAAGFGDLLSKNAATADWVVSHLLLDEYYCPLSAAVVEDALGRCIANAGSIKENRPEGLALLAEALLRSGVSMVMAGSSAPASGGEHLISHLWDMTAHWSGRRPALHGQQTGVATLVCLGLYEKILALDVPAVRRHCSGPLPLTARSDFEAEMQTVFRDIAAAVRPHADRKYPDQRTLQHRRERILARWEDLRRAVAAMVISAADSRAHLQAAGALSRAADLGVSPREMAFAYRYARWIRNRYTVLDLAADLGMLEAWQADVLHGI